MTPSRLFSFVPPAVAASAILAAALAAGPGEPGKERDVEELTRKLWPRERIERALADVDRQKADGILTEASHARRRAMLLERLAGTYRPASLSAEDPPSDFIQNGGFEETNPNSAKNRSRWLWWGGWSWGGDYENMWEGDPEHVHSGKLSARIRCTGATGRIGINTPPLPRVPGATGYRLTFWAMGEGENGLFVNFEEGASGTLREKVGGTWKEHSLTGIPVEGKKTYNVYFYAVGAGTIWLDDVRLVPIGGNLDE